MKAAASTQRADFQYIRMGNRADAPAVHFRAGFALMGGGNDLDEAFQWLCNRAGGGDFVVLRATGDDAYNPYVQKLCHLNSVATLIVPTRAAASNPAVFNIIRRASAVFLSGGDQANYINFWMGTSVQAALNDAIRRGVPLGGTSAGLAVIGEWAYSSQGDKPDDPNLDSASSLADPLMPRITLVHAFLDIPILQGIITDTHFVRRDRMGRLLVFLARLNQPGCNSSPSSRRVQGIGVEESTAALLEPDGRGRVIGSGGLYLIDGSNAGGPPCGSEALTSGPYSVTKILPGHSFNLRSWTSDGPSYMLSSANGKLRSTQAGDRVY